MNKDEIIAKLTKAGITFDATATKKQLEALLPEEADKDDVEDIEPEDLDAELDAINAQKKEDDKPVVKTPEENLADYMKIVAAYKVQNPNKYEAKKEAFSKKIANLKALVK